MEKELQFNGKKFISAKRAAEISGYSSDYVGQLIRAKKISGTLVGRSWYVDRDEVLNHKKLNHLKTTKKENKNKSVDLQNEENVPDQNKKKSKRLSESGEKNHYFVLGLDNNQSRKAEIKPDKILYIKDEAPLFVKPLKKFDVDRGRYEALQALKNSLNKKPSKSLVDKFALGVSTLLMFALVFWSFANVGNIDFEKAKELSPTSVGQEVENIWNLYGESVAGQFGLDKNNFGRSILLGDNSILTGSVFLGWEKISDWFADTAKKIAMPWIRESWIAKIGEQKFIQNPNSRVMGRDEKNGQNIVSKTFVVESSDRSYVDQKIAELKNYFLTSPTAPNVTRYYITNQNDSIVDTLSRPITNLSDVTISGNSSFAGSAGLTTLSVSSTASFTGSSTMADLTVTEWLNIGTTTNYEALTLDGALYLGNNPAPASTTYRLYNTNSGDLYWNGSLLGGASVGNWTTDGTSVWRTSGNVGIGTSSPFASLSVVGDGFITRNLTASNITATGTLNVNGSTTLAHATSTSLYTSTLGLGSEYLTDFTGSGLVNTSGALTVQAGISNLTNYDWTFLNNFGALNIAPTTTMPIWARGGINASSTSNFTYASTTALTSSGSAYFATAGGNVGIGTTNPGAKLEIGGGVSGSDPSPRIKLTDYYDNSGNPSVSHIDLYGGQFGFGISWDNLNIISAADFNFLTGATSRMVIKSGNVGIGTTSPYAKLSVVGDGVFTANLNTANFTATGTVAFTGLSQGFNYTGSNGVQNTIASSSINLSWFNNDSGFTNYAWPFTPQTWGVSTSTTIGMLNGFLSTASSTIVGSATTTGDFAAGNTLFVKQGGNVGIGTTGPGAKLHIVGLSQVAAANNTAFRVSSSNDNTKSLFIGFDTTTGVDAGYIQSAIYGGAYKNLLLNPVSGNVGIGTTSPYAQLSIGMASSTPALAIGVAGSSTPSLFVASANNNGYVGIGTAAPQMPLHVVKSADGYAFLAQFENAQTNNGIPAVELIANNAGARRSVQLFSDGVASKFSISLLNNTPGTIGTESYKFAHTGATFTPLAGGYPVLQLNSYSGSDAELKIYEVANSNNAVLSFVTGGGDRGKITVTPSQYMYFQTGGVDRMTINSSGNVGIGTTSPYAKLSVVGDAAITGNLRVAGLTATGTVSLTNYTSGALATDATGALYTFSTSTWTFASSTLLSDNNTWTARQNFNGNASTTGLTVTGSTYLATTGGNVGIGDTGPDFSLQVNGNAAFGNTGVNTANQTIIDAVGGGRMYQFNSSAVLTNLIQTNGASYINGGNVGIGTTSPAAKLDVYGGMGRFTDTAGRIVEIGSDNGTHNAHIGTVTSHNLKVITNNTATALFATNGGLSVGGTYSATTPPDNGAIIQGNVGIGTTGPGYKLDIQNGTLNIGPNTTLSDPDSETGFRIKLFDTGGVANDMGIGVGGSAGSENLWINGSPTRDIRFIFGANGEKVRITGSGNVGIGTTSPNERLHVTGSSYGAIVLDDNGAGTNLKKWGVSSDDGSLLFGAYTDAHTAFSEKVRINSSGNVGIGTTAPSAPLHVSLVGTNSKNEIAAIFEATGGDTAGTDRGVGVVFKDQSNPTLVAGIAGLRLNSGDDYNGQLAFFTNNSGGSPATTFANMTERMRITNAGNVGIGTTGPGSELDVRGTNSAIISLGDKTLDTRFVELRGEKQAGTTNGGDFFVYTKLDGGVLGQALRIIGGASKTAVFAGNLTVSGAGNTTIAGNVGIGTTEPGGKLDVIGTSQNTIDTSTYGTLNIRSVSGAAKDYGTVLAFRSNPNINAGLAEFTTGAIKVGKETADNNLFPNQHYMSFYTSGNNTWGERMRITSTGALGIGTTTPVHKLTVTDTSASQLSLSAGAGIAQWAFRNAGGNLYFATTTVAGTATTTTSALSIIGSSGNVGIGEAVPGAKLSVSGGVAVGSSYDTTVVADGNMIISGNVGIGTTSPSQLLTVGNNNQFTVTSAGLTTAVQGFSVPNNIKYNIPGYDSAFSNATLRLYGYNQISGDSSGNLSLGNSGPLYISTTGNVGIGTTSPGYKLSVQNTSEGNTFQIYDTDGNCLLDPDSGGITTTCSSDARLKTNIEESNSVIEYLRNIPIKDFTVIASGDRRTGVIAQEMLVDYPELVHMGPDGYYGVSEISSWKIIKGLQEQQMMIEDLQSGQVEIVLAEQRLTALEIDTQATSTTLEGGGLSLIGRILAYFKGFGLDIQNGFTRISKIFVGSLHIEGDVCVDDTCVTKDQFKEMILRSGVGAVQIVGSTPETASSDSGSQASTSTSAGASDSTASNVGTATTTPEIVEITEEISEATSFSQGGGDEVVVPSNPTSAEGGDSTAGNVGTGSQNSNTEIDTSQNLTP